MNKQTQNQETAGRAQRTRKLNGNHNHQVRSNQPGAGPKRPRNGKRLPLPEGMALVELSDGRGSRIAVYQNGSGRLVLDQGISANRCDDDNHYALIRSRSWCSPEQACHALISFAVPEILKPLAAPLLGKLKGADTVTGDIIAEATTAIRMAVMPVRKAVQLTGLSPRAADCIVRHIAAAAGVVSSDTEGHIVRVPFSATEARHIQATAKKLGLTEEEFLSNAIVHKLDHAQRQPSNRNMLATAPQDAVRPGRKGL